MDKLAIPLMTIPTGNPFSGRTWPELSFRTLLPHFYRPQGAWSALIEKQSEDAIRSAVQMFVGLASTSIRPTITRSSGSDSEFCA